MPIYKQTTEITNIDDLLSSVERDIEEVYFGDKNVFTVWAEYDGTLPAQYTANGSALVDYRVYGSAGGVGDRTENCLKIRDGSFTKTSGTTNLTVTAINGVITFDGTVFELPSAMAEWKSNFDFYLDAGTYYITEPPPLISDFGRYIKKYDDNSNIVASGATAFTLPERTRVYLSFYIYDKTFDNTQVKITLVKGSTAPTSYIPYGYKVDMDTRGENLVDVSKWLTDRGVSYQKVDNSYTFNVNLQLYTVPYYFADENKKITIKCQGVNLKPSVNFRINLLDANGTVVKDRAITQSIPETKDVICAGFILDYSIGGQVQLSDFEIFESTTTPIYVGSSPLNAYEYIDYASGKIYRWSSNQLSVPEVREKTNEEITCTVSNDGVYTLTVSDTVQSDRNLSFSYNPVEIPNGKTWVLAAIAENILSNNGSITLGDEIHPVISVNIQNNGYNTTRPFGSSGTTYILDRMAITVRAGTPAGTFTLRPMLMYMEPVDPPVSLPALPTCNGTTIVDYEGQRAASIKFYAKYRKQNF